MNPILISDLRVNLKAREWCKLPYPDHPKGCPNYGMRPSCPPQALLISNYFDITRPLYLIAVEFDLAGHIKKMQSLHPDWSQRQLRCCLYWQGGVNSELKQKCRQFEWEHPTMITTTCPEAMGVNVIETAYRCGLPIETKPTDRVFKIAIGGRGIGE